MLSRGSSFIPPDLRRELELLIGAAVKDCGMVALSWISYTIGILSWILPEVADLGAFRVEQPMFVFEHPFGSDTSHRIRTDTT